MGMLHEIAPKQYRVEYRKVRARKRDRVILYLDNEFLAADRTALRLPTVEKTGPADYQYLFAIDETRYFSVLDTDETARLIRALTEKEPGKWKSIPERGVRYLFPRDVSYAAILSSQLVGWYRRNRFCGRCGHPTVHGENERMMHCPNCKNLIYPQICPSVIVGLFHEGKLLVTRYNPAHREVSNGKLFQAPVHEALLAGYIEIGETAEEAVRREVFEEVGLKVRNIRYYKSTPWPFSGSLLFSYLCEVDGDPTIRLEERELCMAEFRTPEEMPDRSREVSLTSAIMEDFRNGRLPLK